MKYCSRCKKGINIFNRRKNTKGNYFCKDCYNEEAMDIVYDVLKKEGGTGYGSFEIEQLKGGVTYKAYHKWINKNEFEKQAEYIKLIYPDKHEIKFPAVFQIKDLRKTLTKKNQRLLIMRYTFLTHEYIKVKHLYLLMTLDKNDKITEMFDLPEKMALELCDLAGIRIMDYE